MKILKNIMVVLAIVALSVGATALLSRATNGFNDGISSVFYNQDNLVRSLDEYVSKEGNSGNGITWTVKNGGAVYADGTIAASEDEAAFTIGTVQIEEEGFYTLSGAPKNTSMSTFYIKATYEDVGGTQKTLYADFSDTMTTAEKLPAGTEVTIIIVIEPGVSVDNIKFTPTFVLGTEAGKF